MLGRWVSRDPAEEEGGLNLNGMCDNNVIGQVDAVGLLVADRTGYDFAIYFGVGMPNNNTIMSTAAEDMKTHIQAKFKPADGACSNCILSIGKEIQSKELRSASITYDSLYSFTHGQANTRINPRWRSGMPLSARDITRTALGFSDGWIYLADVLTERTVRAKRIVPYACFDFWIDNTNPSGISVHKVLNSRVPNPSYFLITLENEILLEAAQHKCKTLDVKGPT